MSSALTHNLGESEEQKERRRATNREIAERVDLIVTYLMLYPFASAFQLHKVFCGKFNVHWRTVDAYTVRARALLKERLALSKEQAAEIGKGVVATVIMTGTNVEKLKAEESLRNIVGYGAPAQVGSGEQSEGGMKFVDVNVDVGAVTGEKELEKK